MVTESVLFEAVDSYLNCPISRAVEIKMFGSLSQSKRQDRNLLIRFLTKFWRFSLYYGRYVAERDRL
jgi:hypothetical protein